MRQAHSSSEKGKDAKDTKDEKGAKCWAQDCSAKALRADGPCSACSARYPQFPDVSKKSGAEAVSALYRFYEMWVTACENNNRKPDMASCDAYDYFHALCELVLHESGQSRILASKVELGKPGGEDPVDKVTEAAKADRVVLERSVFGDDS